MYVDISQILRETGLKVDEWANHIRNEITEVTGCPCSTGFGANRYYCRYFLLTMNFFNVVFKTDFKQGWQRRKQNLPANFTCSVKMSRNLWQTLTLKTFPELDTLRRWNWRNWGFKRAAMYRYVIIVILQYIY